MTVSILFLLPMALVISSSFSDEDALARHGYSLLPQEFSTAAYEFILRDPWRIVNAYAVTISVTVLGTLAALLVMSLLGYVLSRPDFPYRRPLSFLVIFTMLFNGGLVPTYILIAQVLDLKDKGPVLILPYLVVPWFVFLLRSFFTTLPRELLEAARIDGASEWRVFFQIVIPLSTPALATVGLFCVLMYWNDWWLPLLYIDDPRLFPLQYLLYSVMRNAEYLTSSAAASGLTSSVQVPTQTMRMAMVVLAMGPILVAFLALQRYFVRGLLVGSLKGD
jgi:putative aldouronate transport system permease protein